MAISDHAAMLLAPPREPTRVRRAGAGRALPANAAIASIDIAGPGSQLPAGAGPGSALGTILDQGSGYGRNASGGGRVAGVEYVSANPTGPLHVGHGRAAVIGDCITRVLEANGWAVRREYYYNDAGVQIENLAMSVQARARGITPDDEAGGPATRHLHRRVARPLMARVSRRASARACDVDALDDSGARRGLVARDMTRLPRSGSLECTS